MNEDVILLVLRITAGLSLLSFMGVVVFALRRDYNLAAERSQARRQIRGHLVVMTSESSQPAAGSMLPLAAATTLGRAPSNTIQLDDSYASNEHARVVQRMGQWWLEDRQSSNGTRLNGVPIDEPVVLSSGDIIGIGSVQLRLELDMP